MFLIVLSILGIGMFFSSSSDEIVARNYRDREFALRAAEAAINEAKLRILGMFDALNPPTTAPVALSEDSCSLAPLPTGFTCDQASYTSSTVDLYSATPLGAALNSYLSDKKASPEIAGLAAQPRYLIVLTDITECSQSAVAGVAGSDTRTCFKIFGQAKGRLDSTRVNLIEMYLR